MAFQSRADGLCLIEEGEVLLPVGGGVADVGVTAGVGVTADVGVAREQVRGAVQDREATRGIGSAVFKYQSHVRVA